MNPQQMIERVLNDLADDFTALNDDPEALFGELADVFLDYDRGLLIVSHPEDESRAVEITVRRA